MESLAWVLGFFGVVAFLIWLAWRAVRSVFRVIKRAVLPAKPAVEAPELRATMSIDGPDRYNDDQDVGDGLQKDAWEDGSPYGWMLYGPDARRMAAQLSFTFVDQEGQVTNRSVDVKKFVADDKGGAVWGHCRLRNANRPFVTARMSNVVDLETGEVIDDLPRWLLTRYPETAHGKLDAFVSEHDAALALLVTMGRADGALRAKERALIADWSRRQGANDELVALVLDDVYGSGGKLSAVGIGKCLKDLVTRPAPYPADVVDVMEAMIGTDKTVRDEETRLLARARKALRTAQ